LPWFMSRPLTPGFDAMRRPSAVDRYLHSPSPLSLSSPSAPSTLCAPSRSLTPVAQLIQTRPVTPGPSVLSDATDSIADMPSETRRQRTFSMIREEPLLRPSSRRTIKPQRTTGSDDFSTALEWPQVSLDAVLCDRGAALASPRHRGWHESSRPEATSPEQSTEYLQRYQKVRGPPRGEVEDHPSASRKGRKKVSIGAELRRLFMGR
jgi:hypothetical protein